MRILVDMDDTLTKLCEPWLKALNERHGTHVQMDDIVEWDISGLYPNLTTKELYAPTNEDSFWDGVEPVDGAIEYIDKLREDGHEIIVVTSSHPMEVNAKINRTLLKYFPFFNGRSIVITGNKQLIQGDVLIDDGPHNLEGGTYRKILMSAPHNRYYDAEANGMYRVSSWEEAYKCICMINTEVRYGCKNMARGE